MRFYKGGPGAADAREPSPRESPAASSAGTSPGAPVHRVGQPFSLFSEVRHRGVAGNPEEVLISALVTKTEITFQPIDNFERTRGCGSVSTGLGSAGASASRPPAPRGAPRSATTPRPRGSPFTTGQSPPRLSPDTTSRLLTLAPTRTSETRTSGTGYNPRARGAYRGRRLVARRPALPICPIFLPSLGCGGRRPDPPAALELSACAPAGGRPAGRGRRAALLLLRRRRPPHAPPAPPGLWVCSAGSRRRRPPAPRHRLPPAPPPPIGRRLQAPSAPPRDWARTPSLPPARGLWAQPVRNSQAEAARLGGAWTPS